PDNIEVFEPRVRAMAEFTSTGWEPVSTPVGSWLLPYMLVGGLLLALYLMSFSWIKRAAVDEAVSRGAMPPASTPAGAFAQNLPVLDPSAPAVAVLESPRSGDAMGILKFILVVLQTLAWLGIIFGSVGVVQVLTGMWYGEKAPDAVGSLWNDLLFF